MQCRMLSASLRRSYLVVLGLWLLFGAVIGCRVSAPSLVLCQYSAGSAVSFGFARAEICSIYGAIPKQRQYKQISAILSKYHQISPKFSKNQASGQGDSRSQANHHANSRNRADMIFLRAAVSRPIVDRMFLCARVAQLDRVAASEAEGCGFNSRRAHHYPLWPLTHAA